MQVKKITPDGEICPLLSTGTMLVGCVGPGCRWYYYGPNRCALEYVSEIAAATSKDVDRAQGYSIAPLIPNCQHF